VRINILPVVKVIAIMFVYRCPEGQMFYNVRLGVEMVDLTSGQNDDHNETYSPPKHISECIEQRLRFFR